MAYIRKFKTASGATGVQVCYKEHSKVVKTVHVGSANSPEGLEKLLVKAQKIIDEGKRSLFNLSDFWSLFFCGWSKWPLFLIYFFSFKFHLLINLLPNYLYLFMYLSFISLSFLSILIYINISTVLIFWLILYYSRKRDASRLFNLVFCFNNFTLYAIDFSKEGIEMVFSGVD